MKKIMVLAAAVLLALGAGAARAELSLDSGDIPGKGQFTLGLQNSWILSRDFKNINAKVTRASAGYSVAARDIKVTDDKSLMASIAYGVSAQFSVFAKLGAQSGGRFKFSNWDADTGTWWSNKFRLKTVFTWALGAKLRVFETAGGLGALLAAQYQRHDNRKTGDMDSLQGGVSLNDFKADFWQADLALGVYQKLGAFTPYIGLGYEHAEQKIAGHANLGTPYANHIDFGGLENTDSLNALVGLGWRASDHLSLTLQGNFIAHNAVGLGISWSF